MGLFNFCCPTPSKKNFDYIVELLKANQLAINALTANVATLNEWQKEIISQDLKPIFDEYASTYDYSAVIPQLDTLAHDVEILSGQVSALDTAVGNKISKVIPETEGNLAALSAAGAIVDSHYAPTDFAAADHNHDSSYAAKNHSHTSISKDSGGEVFIDENSIVIGVLDDQENDKQVTIDKNNIDNLYRALVTPSSAPEDNSGKLITSKAVYDALRNIEYLNDYVTINLTRDTSSSSLSFLVDDRVLNCLRTAIGNNIGKYDTPIVAYVRQNNGTSFTGKNAFGIMTYDRDITENESNQTVTEFTVQVYIAGLCLYFRNVSPGEVDVPSNDLSTWEDYDPLSPTAIGITDFFD